MLTQQLRNSYCYSAWTWRFLLPPPTLPAPIPAGAASPSTTAIPAGPWHSHGSPPLSHQDPFQAGVSHEDCIYIYKSIKLKRVEGWAVRSRNNHSSTYKGWKWIYQSNLLYRGFLSFRAELSAGPTPVPGGTPSLLPPLTEPLLAPLLIWQL